VQHVLGLSVPAFSGPGTLVKTYIGVGRYKRKPLEYESLPDAEKKYP
jgi:hypothetical protein